MSETDALGKTYRFGGGGDRTFNVMSRFRVKHPSYGGGANVMI